MQKKIKRKTNAMTASDSYPINNNLRLDFEAANLMEGKLYVPGLRWRNRLLVTILENFKYPNKFILLHMFKLFHCYSKNKEIPKSLNKVTKLSFLFILLFLLANHREYWSMRIRNVWMGEGRVGAVGWEVLIEITYQRNSPARKTYFGNLLHTFLS